MKVFINIEWKAFRKLSASLQQAWIYGWTNCDSCGVFDFDEDYARVDLKREIQASEYDTMEEAGVVKISENKYLFVDFISVNYVALKEGYNPHKPAFRALQKNDLHLNENSNAVDTSFFLNGFKLNNKKNQACGKLEDEEEDKEEEEGEEEDKRGKKPKQKIIKKPTITFPILMPWESEKFLESWQRWKNYKAKQFNFKYKSEDSEQAALHDLAKVSDGLEENAIAIINQSISKGWKGLFKLQIEINGNSTNREKQPTGANVNTSDAFAEINRRYG